ncbi:MAG: hypothetical protein JRI94_04590 [Deltaproteobacteria bacterium]|nr:hypothetical protein [Deltaproteobacteria bacterium]
MKILFIADVPLEEPTSGSEQVLHQQAVGLAREGMEVYAITRQEGLPSFTIRDVFKWPSATSLSTLSPFPL